MTSIGGHEISYILIKLEINTPFAGSTTMMLNRNEKFTIILFYLYNAGFN